MRSGLFLLCAASMAMAAVDFPKQIAPVLESKCQACHGAKQQMANLRLDGATAVSPKLMERIRSTKPGFRMPPVGAPLSEAEIAAFQEWLNEGAKFPAGYQPGAAKPVHWSFRALEPVKPPAVKNPQWVKNAIDAFVLAKLETEKLTPSPEADRTTLLRRVSLDLTGLPPTPGEIEQFVRDGNYEQAVDRLLASPRYGERWARMWLDLARYADSDGYEKDRERPYAWRYRQWVIEALNRDMPFDQFTIEQLAGDLLPRPTMEQLVATGFQRNTLTNREAGVDRAEDRFEQLVNRVNTLSTTWLGLTVGCAQCHDHKYDPITNKDFYRLFAFFDSAEEVEIEAPLQGEREAYTAALPGFLAARGHILEQYGVAELRRKWEDKLRFAIENPGKDIEWDFSITSMRAMFDRAQKILMTDPEQRSARDRRRLTDYFVASPGPDNNRDPELRDRLKEAREKLQAIEAKMPPLTMSAAMGNDPDFQTAHLRIRGDYRNKGDAIEPGGLAALPAMRANGRASRLDLAKWLVSLENPLTARVTVNRAWQEFFGRGIVRTSEDFGTQGERPSHPELLDWLAADFMRQGWSLKKLHRTIVLSATYRQASDSRPEIDAKDPENTLLARQMRLRLPAEAIRDSALFAGGLLDNRIGGPSVKPPQPAGVAELGYAGSIKWRESEGADKYRRGLYIHFQRTTPYPQLMNFDAPDSNVACSRRRRSNTPLQSLNLLNDPVFFEAAQAFARRVMESSNRFDTAFLLAVGRKPAAVERERLARYYDEQHTILSREPEAAAKLASTTEAATWVALSRVLLNLDEFITRE